MLWIVLLAASIALATPRTETRRGNVAAGKGQADDAMVHYKQALEQKGDSSVILYDLGNLMYQGGQYESAEKSYLGSVNSKSPLDEQSAAFYNLGNTYFESQKYDQAAKAYVEALKRMPSDSSAKYNLELALRMLQQQKQQQKQDQDQNQNQDQKDQKQQQSQDQNQQQKDQEQQQQQKQEEQEKQEQQKAQQQQDSLQNQQQQAQQQPQQAKQMSPEEAQRILNALLQNEQDALKQAKKVKVQTRPKREKDW
jgi:tetratricopeptide (TPR) repeat protein